MQREAKCKKLVSEGPDHKAVTPQGGRSLTVAVLKEL